MSRTCGPQAAESRPRGVRWQVAGRLRAAGIAGACLTVLAAMPVPARAVTRYEGFAYARGTQRLLYREVHWLYEQAGVSRQLVLYQCPDGQPFARAAIRDAPSAIAPDFAFLDGRDGYREGVRTRDGRRQVYFQDNSRSPVRAKRLPDEPNGVIDAGFDAFARSHWRQLASGASLEAPFLLPSRLEFIDFKISGGRQGPWHGRPALRLRMGVAAWYAFALPSIDLVYGRRSRRLLQYSGIGVIRDARGRNAYVRIEFPKRARRAQVPRDEALRAATQPLTGHCGA